MTRCPNCSGQNAETQRFCGECGTPLPADLRVVVTVPETDETIPLPSLELPPGSVFAGRYHVIEELGAGGMGRVYRVLDQKLGEEIALKVIRPDVASDRAAIARFSSELKLARQVVHRNVARMFDLNEESGAPYITMEYVRGEDLKRLIRKVGLLSPAQAVPIACQICEGLAEAHRRGIVHRDLKPQNVMIDDEGQAKIMDFGLARLLAQEGGDGFASRSGSPAYVSPEQVRGTAPDGRSDLYSLGIVLYEMLTGRTPFKGDSVKAIIDRHLHEVPEEPRQLNPAIPADLSRIVMKCLAKDPGERYQSAAELRQALGCVEGGPGTRISPGVRRGLWIGAAAGVLAVIAAIVLIVAPTERWKRSLAVLPIEDTGMQEVNRNFLAGLQDQVTSRLSDIRGLRVLPVPSVNSLDRKGKSIPEIGKQLGVAYLVRMTLAVEGGRVDAQIYLIEAQRNANPAPMIYTKDITSYRALQEEIAILTARALGVQLDPEQVKRAGWRGTNNIEAYGLYLEGKNMAEQAETEEEVRLAIGKYLRAIEIDPDFALAHWGLGYAYENLYYSRRKDKDPVVLEKMFEHLSRASQLDPSFAETNLGLGWYYFNKGDNAKAFESFRKALKLEPDGYIVNRDSGAFLRSIGLYRQALPYLARAAELSPRDPLPLVQIAQCWLFLGRSEKAMAYTEKALALRESEPDAGIMQAILLALTGKFDQAESRIKTMERFGVHIERIPFLREVVTALREGRGKPYVFLTDRPGVTPQGTYIYLSLGMKDEALANIQAGIERGFWDGMVLYSYPSLVKNPWYLDLRGDPRFESVLKRQKELYDKELKPFEKL